MEQNDFNSEKELAERQAKMFWKSRNDAGKSQEYMALSIGVSKNTVSNWERGLSSPTIRQMGKWFKAIGLNPLRYLLNYYHGDAFDSAKIEDDDIEVSKILHDTIDLMPIRYQLILLFILAGSHGSSYASVLEMIDAHLHCDMRSRVGVADLIARNFELCEAIGTLVCDSDTMPNLELLLQSIELGKNAAFNNQQGYTTMHD